MASAHDRLGFVRGEQGRTEEALAGFAKAVALDPTLFDAQYHLGATLWWTERASGVARAAGSGAAPPRARRGALLPGAGHAPQRDLPGAVGHLRQAVRLNPALAPVHLQLGAALREWGDGTAR